MKKNVLNFVFFCLAVFSCSSTSLNLLDKNKSTLSKFVFSNWQMQFEDNFNSSSSMHKWEKAERPDFNSDNCIYKSSNPKIAVLDDYSCLVLTAKKNGKEYESGHVKSFYMFKPEKNEEYRVEAKIKLVGYKGNEAKPFADTYGARARFWTSEEKYWPTKGEINILDSYSYGNNAKYSTNLMFGKNIGEDMLANSMQKKYDVNEGWHIYTMFWTNVNGKNVVKILLDETEIASYTNSENPNLKLENFGSHNILFNLNVGSNDSTFKNQSIKLFNKTEMYIDWVKVDKRKVTKLAITNP